MTTTKSASATASRRLVVAQTLAGKLLSLIIRPTNDSMRRSLVSVGDIRANSLSRNAGVARMSWMSVLQNTTLPAPIIAIFLGITLSLGHMRSNAGIIT